jgi:two-component system, chemotaxis family, CheB/CheR fusion protein
MARKSAKSGSRKRKTAPTKRSPPRRPDAVVRQLRAVPPTRRPAIIVGVGASAGGLEAFSQLLQALPPNPGLAMVLVQHLAPQHESALVELLANRTPLPVVQVTQNMPVERNHIYVIPPNVQMSISRGVLHLAARPSDRTQYNPIDHFLRSLAEFAHDRAIGVILSGTASDGAVGIRDIKAVGGITMAQDPDSAKYDGMPRAAIAGGFIDLVLPPARIAEELVSIARHPLTQTQTPPATVSQVAAPANVELQMDQVFSRLRASTGVDFRRYKRPTIDRRLQRRMVLHKIHGLDEYLRYIRDHPEEVAALYQDILIHVTRFFRDPESVEALAAHVTELIKERLHDEQPIRVWVPGCSTGEEAYSVAIIILELLTVQEDSVAVQVFATDISDPAIEHARAGVYGENITADVSPERLRRFFTKVQGGYRINKVVRDVCIFARQDLTRDPPFSKLDLIVCRNVLIYLSSEMQQKLMSVFHYALKPNGSLMLGNAETIGSSGDLFASSDRKHRLFRKRADGMPGVNFQLDRGDPAALRDRRPVAVDRDDGRAAQSEASRVIQERYAPPGVIVDDKLNVVQFRGQTGAFLEPAPGEPSVNVLKMAREGLLHGLRDSLQQARKSKIPVRKDGVRVRANGGWREVRLEVTPLSTAERRYFLVLFDDVTRGSKSRQRRSPAQPIAEAKGGVRASQRVASLQRELASSREYLQSIIHDLEAANEELQSANEEVLSANEELQSTNEELDTAKEELQSTNEELNTVNDELQGRNEELSRVNSDLVNLLSSVNIAIVIVASDLRIRRFTPMAERTLNLIPSDIGRPISHIKPNIDCPDLEDLISQVIDTVTPLERDVQDVQGSSYSLRIRPYKNLENRIDGAVLALFDSNLPDSQRATDGDRRSLAALADMSPDGVLLLEGGGRIIHGNRMFCETFGFTPAQLTEHSLFQLGDGEWDIPRLRALLDSHSPASQADGVEFAHDFPRVGHKAVSGRRVGGAVILRVADGGGHQRDGGGRNHRGN